MCPKELALRAYSAGSIGTQTLDIIREHKDRFELVALAAGGNVKLLAEQVSSCPSLGSHAPKIGIAWKCPCRPVLLE